MSVSVVYNLLMNMEDTVVLGWDLASDKGLDHAISDASGTLDATSTPVVSQAFSDQVQLAAGTLTLDLTALIRGNATLSTLTLDGLKVQAHKWRALSTNTANVVIADGATNGYQIFGDSVGSITLGPGDQALFLYSETLQDVSATTKTIDITSGDADAKVDVLIAAG